MIKAVIFDLDDTLYDYISYEEGAQNAVIDEASSYFGIERAVVEKAYFAGKKQAKIGLETVAAGHNRMMYVQRMLEELGVSPVEHSIELYEAFWGYILNHISLNDYVIPLFEELKKRGVKIALCSDLTTNIQHRKINKLGIGKYIDVLVTSEEAGIEKPSPKMYELVLKKLKMNVDEVIMGGDSMRKDVDGPSAIGIKGIHFDGDGDKFSSEILSVVKGE